MDTDPILKVGTLIIQRGIHQVYERGVKVGTRDTKHKIALNLLQIGLDEADILKVTELTAEEFAEIRKPKDPEPGA
ncbi:MAG: hypothetical protein IJU79_04760 [Desulfovibrionaceae bacterium]|nr:hypothetical protein [Desulfovibrionaceae bacterium]